MDNSFVIFGVSGFIGMTLSLNPKNPTPLGLFNTKKLCSSGSIRPFRNNPNYWSVLPITIQIKENSGLKARTNLTNNKLHLIGLTCILLAMEYGVYSWISGNLALRIGMGLVPLPEAQMDFVLSHAKVCVLEA